METRLDTMPCKCIFYGPFKEMIEVTIVLCRLTDRDVKWIPPPPGSESQILCRLKNSTVI